MGPAREICNKRNRLTHCTIVIRISIAASACCPVSSNQAHLMSPYRVMHNQPLNFALASTNRLSTCMQVVISCLRGKKFHKNGTRVGEPSAEGPGLKPFPSLIFSEV